MSVALATEASARFACFGAACGLLVRGDGADEAVDGARRLLLEAHARFTRFDAASELSRLNDDPNPEVRVSDELAQLAEAVWTAGWYSGGLVDATLLGPLEQAGYATHLTTSVPLADALRRAPARRPAGPDPARRWSELRVSRVHGTVRRPPGLRIDGGGLIKGLLADRLAETLAAHPSFGIDCAGDLRIGGAAGLPRTVHVESPFDGSRLHTFELTDAGIATSGIGRRSWIDAAGRPAHHLLDPATRRPAFTGLVQVTAIAPTAFEAELRAKTALLSGADDAARWLPDGGVTVADDGSFRTIAMRA
jgi:thiamine biosynthesis lipoprotein